MSDSRPDCSATAFIAMYERAPAVAKPARNSAAAAALALTFSDQVKRAMEFPDDERVADDLSRRGQDSLNRGERWYPPPARLMLSRHFARIAADKPDRLCSREGARPPAFAESVHDRQTAKPA
jgi:hypothetical protein